MSDTPPATTRQKLIALRVTWAALLLGQMMFLTVAIVVVHSGSSSPVISNAVKELLFFAGCALLAGGLLAGHVIRGVLTSRESSPRGTSVKAYFVGTLVLLALLEAPGLLGGMIIVLSRTPMPGAVLAGMAIVMTLVHFPIAASVDESL